MSYEYDDEARNEAARHRISANELAELRDRCMRKFRELGDVGLRGHSVKFSVSAWHGLPSLPDLILNRGCISRGDVLDIGEQARTGKLSPLVLLAASFAWGTGMTGYGPHRYREIIDAAESRLEPSLQKALDAACCSRDSSNPIAGYAQLYGGYARNASDRATPGQEPWSRLHGLGPAFFTKFLYFAVPGALILDNNVAKAVHDLSNLPNLVTDDGQSVAWTPYRYAVYLHWMRQTAEAVGVWPAMLELTLFKPPTDPMDDQDVATS
jgi:hypothetical protein